MPSVRRAVILEIFPFSSVFCMKEMLQKVDFADGDLLVAILGLGFSEDLTMWSFIARQVELTIRGDTALASARNPRAVRLVFAPKSSVRRTVPFGGFLHSQLSKNPDKVTP